MIQTFEQKLQDLKNSIKDIIGTESTYVFKNSIKYRETPHTPTKYISSISVNELNNYSIDELYSIKQRLKSEQ